MGSMLCNNCAHVVNFSVCKAVDGTQQKVTKLTSIVIELSL